MKKVHRLKAFRELAGLRVPLKAAPVISGETGRNALLVADAKYFEDV
jgi:hypothetical protein